MDALVGHMTRVREDDRFKSVGPESMVFVYPAAPGLLASGQRTQDQEQEGEIWFDWTFIDFWKSNHCASDPIPELMHCFMPTCIVWRISWMGSFPLSSHIRPFVGLYIWQWRLVLTFCAINRRCAASSWNQSRYSGHFIRLVLTAFLCLFFLYPRH